MNAWNIGWAQALEYTIVEPGPSQADWSRWIILAGIALVVLGALLRLGPRLPWLGRLPGDILLRRGNFTFYLPLTTCLIFSLLFTLLWRLWKH
jgi:hypothetical protein